MHIRKILAGAAVGLSFLVPAVTQAAGLTSDQANAVISLLQSFNVDAHTIATVQMVLTGQNPGSGMNTMGSSTMPWMNGTSTMSWHDTGIGMRMPGGQMGKMMCVSLTRDLGPGSQGSDVTNLQQMLAQDPTTGFSASPTGFFGPLTQQAMLKFQQNNNISSSATGVVGPLTLAFFGKRCGGNGNQQGGMRGMGATREGLFGTISANNTSSITITSASGTSTVVDLTASTTIRVFAGTSTPPTVGSTANLTVGQSAIVRGPRNSDGSINAFSILVGVTLPTTASGMMPMMPWQGGQGGNNPGMMPMMGYSQNGSNGQPPPPTNGGQ